VCDLFPAKFVTYGDRLAHENPFFYCEQCYREFHFSREEQLLYNDFQVYGYSECPLPVCALLTQPWLIHRRAVND
jgi:hypothetical protein